MKPVPWHIILLGVIVCLYSFPLQAAAQQPPVPGNTGLSLVETGIKHLDDGEPEKAEDCFRPALAMGEDARDRLVQGAAWFGFGLLAIARADYANGIDTLKRAVGFLTENTPQTRFYLARVHIALGAAFLDRDDPNQAKDALAKAFALADGDDLQILKQDIVYQLARVEFFYGLIDNARQLLKDNLNKRTALLGPYHPLVAETCLRLGEIYELREDYTSAWDYDFEALHVLETAYGKDHPRTARAYAALGNLARLTSDYKYATTLLQKAMDIQEKNPGRQTPDYADTSVSLGMLYLALQQRDHARAALELALDVHTRFFGEHSLRVAMDNFYLGEIYRDTMQLTQAAELERKALDVQKSILGENHPALANTLNSLAVTLYYQNDLAGSLDAQRAAVKIDALDAASMSNETAVADFNNLATLLLEMKQPQQAVAQYVQALNAEINNPDTNPLRRAALFHNLGEAYAAAGDDGHALASFRKSLELMQWTLGLENQHVADEFFNMAECQMRLGYVDEAEKNYKYFVRVTGPEDPRADIVIQKLKDMNRWSESEPAPKYLPRYPDRPSSEK